MIGEIVGNFRVIRLLGRGGMGEVWLAEHKDIRTKVAIKVLQAHISEDQVQVQRFFNEAVAVSRIKHAGITKIFDVGYHAQRAYLVMEFLEGMPLSARIRERDHLGLGELADIGAQIAGVLEATHAEGITHRDLKPDNVFLVADSEMARGERVKVLDFGIAKLGTATGITGTGHSMGTPAYMSPEQWLNSTRVDHRADIYSLGCLVFEMASGRPPFTASSIGEACNLHLNTTPPSLLSLVAVPPNLDMLVQRLLAKTADGRPAIREIRQTLGALRDSQSGMRDATLPSGPTPAIVPQTLRDDGNPTTLGSAANAASPRSGRPLKIWLPVVALAAAGLAITIYLLAGPRDEPHATIEPKPPPADASVALPPLPKPGPANAFVRIDLPDPPIVLGVSATAKDDVVGFRASRNILSPTKPYEIQEHEVAWAEIEDWLHDHPDHAPPTLPKWATDRAARARLPATGLTWSAALAYCKSISALLPTEEQWELAARGAERRVHPWGSAGIDVVLTHAFAGPDAVPAAVASSDQDRTPTNLYDMAGNVQEWTFDLWRDDKPKQNEAWVQDAESHTSYRAIRGLPLQAAVPKAFPTETTAYRAPLCATGICVEKARKVLPYVGFRCARERR